MGQAREVIPYDFRKSHLAAQRGLARLTALHAAFAAGLAKSLTEHVAAPIDVASGEIEQSRFDEFLGSLISPGCVSVLRFDPPGAQAVLSLSPSILFPMINRLLGGGSCAAGPLVPTRRLTQIERGLALAIIERAAGQLADTWSSVAPVAVREEELLSDPRDARIMPADEVVTVMRLEVNIGDGGLFPISGTINLCLPAPIVELTPDAAAAPTDANHERDAQRMSQRLLGASIELRALLAETKLRMNDVLSMQVGDVITTELSADTPVPVQVQGLTKFLASPGQMQGNRAVEIIARDGDGAAQ